MPEQVAEPKNKGFFSLVPSSLRAKAARYGFKLCRFDIASWQWLSGGTASSPRLAVGERRANSGQKSNTVVSSS
jgi:hypothetical protein